jgi:hypothetical protein
VVVRRPIHEANHSILFDIQFKNGQTSIPLHAIALIMSAHKIDKKMVAFF